MFIDNTTPAGQLFIEASYGASTVNTIVSPTTNTNGLLIRTLNLQVTPGTAVVALFADTAAPTGVSDTTKRKIFQAGTTQTAPVQNVLPYPLALASGWGLYLAVDAAATGDGGITMTYDLVSL